MKTQEQKNQDAKNYINKSAQHLFIVNDNVLTKVITFTQDDVDYYAKLEINTAINSVNLRVRKTNEYYKWDMKEVLFPQYVKTKSIPYFKQMRQLVRVIEFEINNGDNKALIEKIKELSKGIELIK